MRVVRWGVTAVVLLAAVAWGAYVVRNPETKVIDDAARAGAPGALMNTGAGRTYYEVAGPADGRVVVLVHGFSVPSYIWEPTFQMLASAGYRVVRYDLFGRGLSDRPDAAYDGPFYDAQIDGLLDGLRVTGPIDLVGLSFGGFVVAHYASRHPDRIRSLTLVDPTTTRRVLPWYLAAPGLGPYLFQVMAVPGMAEGQTGDFLHPERFPGWVERYRPQMQYDGFGRALYRSALAQTQVDFDGYYDAIAKAGLPVLLVWGRHDRTLPIANAEPVRQRIPSLRFVVVEDAGHLPHMEQPAVFTPQFLAFLEQSAGPRSASR